MLKNKRNLIFIALVWILSILGYVWIIKQPFSEQLSLLAQTHKLSLFAGLVLIKIAGLVWPPLPGGVFNLAVIPFIGWQLAYLSDLTGTVIGALIDYSLAKKYGYKLLDKIFDENTVEKIKNLKIKTGRQAEFSFMMTLSSRLLLTEVSYYAAGLLKLNFWQFLAGAIGSHLLLGIPGYYSTGWLFSTKQIYLGILGWVILIPLWLKIKDRYFDNQNV